ncbi:hypothetical protein BYT27DRAFT_7179666 [Phlegmacium glaucopus]|nr:hypothetical protein BYT27DRAFT_7179666 [Phlegmacium glaucopus]
MAARSTHSLTDNHITHIVSVCADPIPAEAPGSGNRHMRIQSVEDVDYADLLIHLPAACRSGTTVWRRCIRSQCSRHLQKRSSCRCIFDVVTTNSHHTSIGYSQKCAQSDLAVPGATCSF